MHKLVVLLVGLHLQHLPATTGEQQLSREEESCAAETTQFLQTERFLAPFAEASSSSDVSSTVSGTYAIGPKFTADPATVNYSLVPKGRLFTFNMSVSASRYYNCTHPTLTTNCDKERQILVYIPHQYEDGAEAGLLIMQDFLGRSDYSNVLMNIMDNMIGSSDPNRSLPLFVLVCIHSANAMHDGVGSMRDLEYDTVSGRYAAFVENEVLPAVTANKAIRAKFPSFRITSDPEGRASLGCSSGGLAALGMAWFRPDLFRRVIAYSASVVLKDQYLTSNQSFPLGGWDFIELISNSEKKPLRIFHSSSEFDLGTHKIPWITGGCSGSEHNIENIDPNGHNDWVLANNLTARALEAKSYDTRYAYARGACHCDGRVVNHDLPNSLAWLWQGWAPNRNK